MEPGKRRKPDDVPLIPRFESPQSPENHDKTNYTPIIPKIAQMDSITKLGANGRKRRPYAFSMIKYQNSKKRINDPIKRKLTFNHYSRIQHQLRLRIETLFLACMVYDDLAKIKEENHQQETITENQKFIIFFIACKFQEIYPPFFKTISDLFNYEKQLSDYRNEQIKVFMSLKMNLKPKRGPFFEIGNFPILSQYLKGQNQLKSFIFYILEIAISEQRVCLRFTWKEILSALCLFIQDSANKNYSEGSPILECYRALKIAKRFKNHRDPVFYKYAKEQHFFCSTLPEPKIPQSIGKAKIHINCEKDFVSEQKHTKETKKTMKRIS